MTPTEARALANEEASQRPEYEWEELAAHALRSLADQVEALEMLVLEADQRDSNNMLGKDWHDRAREAT